MNSAWLIDLFVVLVYFTVIIGIGLYMGRREDSLHDFALGGRRIPWWAVLASIIAAETSAGTFFGTPGEGFNLRNFTYLQLAIGTIIARILVSYIFLKPYYQHNVYSIYEYLATRFGTRTKNAASAVFLVTRTLASGSRIYVAAIILVLAVEMFRGVPLDADHKLLVYVLASVAITVLTAIYTTLGGIKAVIWTDFIQATIMMGSALAAGAILFFSIPNGWAGVKQILSSDVPANLFFASGLDPARHGWDQVKGMFESEYTVFAIVGVIFLNMATFGTDQDMVQRMLTAPDVRRARRSLILSGLADIPIAFTFLGIGVLLYAYFHALPDQGQPRANNEVFAYYILHRLPAGMRGLLLAGIFATAMGSLSTALNALATSFVRDWYQPFINRTADERQSLRAVRGATVCFAVLLVAVSAATSYVVIKNPGLRIIPIILGVFGYTYGSLLGVFFAGMLTRQRGNDTGNPLAMLAGFLAVAVVSGLPNQVWQIFSGGNLYAQPAWLPVMEWPWWVMSSSLATFFVAICFRTPGEAVVARVPAVEPAEA